MPGPIFYDSKRRRWKHLRRTADAAGVVFTFLVVFFVVAVFRLTPLPQFIFPPSARTYHALKEKEKRKPRPHRVARRSKTPPTQVRLNSTEGIRAAFYVNWDPASYSSLREYLPQIDLLFPEWLHAITDDGHLLAMNEDGSRSDVIRNGVAQKIDDKVMPLLHAEQAETEVLPMVSNFDGLNWIPVTGLLNSPAARANFRQQIMIFLASDHYRGLTFDFESFPPEGQPGYQLLLSELEQDLHGQGLKLYVAVPAKNPDYNYQAVAAKADGVILMNYDEHYPGGEPGAVASQEWFTNNLSLALKDIPPEKLICAISNYGYDWQLEERKVGGRKKMVTVRTSPVSVQDAWVKANESEADVDFDGDQLNPHLVFLEGPDVRHEVWFTDAVTALNQMRAAQRLGINTFALWRLGAEDRSLWNVWDTPQDPAAPQKLHTVPPGQDVTMEGQGDIVTITARPANGERTLEVDASTGLVTNEDFTSLPVPYELTEYGGTTKQIAISFDDGPDPQWTPRILDVLKAKQVKGLFFLIGAEAEKYPSITRRIFNEGHEIGNHTWTHPDISAIKKQQLQVELNVTERFFEARLGIKPLLFRPPYSIDQEPDTEDEVRPLQVTQDMGYITWSAAGSSGLPAGSCSSNAKPV